jgi:hypothetical protein
MGVIASGFIITSNNKIKRIVNINKTNDDRISFPSTRTLLTGTETNDN